MKTFQDGDHVLYAVAGGTTVEEAHAVHGQLKKAFPAVTFHLMCGAVETIVYRP